MQASSLTKYHAQIICRHFLLQNKLQTLAFGRIYDILQISHSPIGISGSERSVEPQIRLHRRSSDLVRSITNQHPSPPQYPSTTFHQTQRCLPRRDVYHIYAQRQIERIFMPFVIGVVIPFDDARTAPAPPKARDPRIAPIPISISACRTSRSSQYPTVGLHDVRVQSLPSDARVDRASGLRVRVGGMPFHAVRSRGRTTLLSSLFISR
mmetsp:Transcript_27383/g.65814  ORF Transcript_27383/g.65814 Transcript_27383/m.65814 type:complete len:209 (-) Transcript_27383:257-883(-)